MLAPLEKSYVGIPASCSSSGRALVRDRSIATASAASTRLFSASWLPWCLVVVVPGSSSSSSVSWLVLVLVAAVSRAESDSVSSPVSPLVAPWPGPEGEVAGGGALVASVGAAAKVRLDQI